MKLLIVIICFPFANMCIINYIFYILMCVFVIFYLIIQGGYSFLHTCALNRRSDVCSFLISRGVNINQVDVVSIVFHYSCVTTDNIYRIYPFRQRCKTCYIMWENGGNQNALFFHEVYNRSYISDRSRYLTCVIFTPF